MLKAAVLPGRVHFSSLSDHYTDWGIDSSWLKSMGKSDSLSANVRFEHERGNLRASCALAFVGDGTDSGCARYELNEWRAAVRYTWHGKVGVTVSPFSISGSRNFNLYDGNGRPDSNGVLGQIDVTPWGQAILRLVRDSMRDLACSTHCTASSMVGGGIMTSQERTPATTMP